MEDNTLHLLAVGPFKQLTGPDQDLMTQALLKLSAGTGYSVDQLAAWMLGAQQLFALCHEMSVKGGWWHDIRTGETLDRNKGELICLMHSELSEMMEGERKNLDDDKLPHRKMAEVELADAFVRGGDYAGGFGYDPISAMLEKMAFNMTRDDHKPENRAGKNGKGF